LAGRLSSLARLVSELQFRQFGVDLLPAAQQFGNARFAR
jgi:hypothetical protein